VNVEARPLPLRFWPSMAAVGLAVATGSLAVGTCAFAGEWASLLAAPGAGALWLFAATCLYQANQQSIGRIPQERAERFVLCLLLAIPIFVAIVVFGSSVYERFGGRM
jgi:hypothetical protein